MCVGLTKVKRRPPRGATETSKSEKGDYGYGPYSAARCTISEYHRYDAKIRALKGEDDTF